MTDDEKPIEDDAIETIKSEVISIRLEQQYRNERILHALLDIRDEARTLKSDVSKLSDMSSPRISLLGDIRRDMAWVLLFLLLIFVSNCSFWSYTNTKLTELVEAVDS